MRGMGNMQNMMRQMQKLQKQMSKEQDEINESIFVGKSSEDLVITKFTGDKKIQDIKIDKKIIDPDDPDMLQDLIIQSIDDAMSQINKMTEEKLGKYTRGLIH